MTEPRFLTLDEVVRIHGDQILRYGGLDGIRGMGLLTSAIAMPEAGYGDQYAHEDLASMAAAYLYHIVQNHPFVDGNKRVGVVAALVFLALNDLWIDVPEVSLEALVWSVARGETGKARAARILPEERCLLRIWNYLNSTGLRPVRQSTDAWATRPGGGE